MLGGISVQNKSSYPTGTVHAPCCLGKSVVTFFPQASVIYDSLAYEDHSENTMLLYVTILQ